MFAWRRVHIDVYLLPCTRLKPMWIKDLNIKQDTLNLIKYTVEDSLKIIGMGNNNLKRWVTGNALKSTIDKLDFITHNIRQRTLSNRERRRLSIEREKSFTNSTLNTGIMPKVNEEVKKLYIKKTNNPINDWYTYLYR